MWLTGAFQEELIYLVKRGLLWYYFQCIVIYYEVPFHEYIKESSKNANKQTNIYTVAIL